MELVVRVAGNGDGSRLIRMLDLAMAALLTSDVPAILLELP
jgi:hypothetical protein